MGVQSIKSFFDDRRHDVPVATCQATADEREVNLVEASASCKRCDFLETAPERIVINVPTIRSVKPLRDRIRRDEFVDEASAHAGLQLFSSKATSRRRVPHQSRSPRAQGGARRSRETLHSVCGRARPRPCAYIAWRALTVAPQRVIHSVGE